MQVVENAVNAVKYLKSRGCEDIEFSPEDAGRSEPAFLYRILEAVIKAGATTLNIPDTVSPSGRGACQSAVQAKPTQRSQKSHWHPFGSGCNRDHGILRTLPDSMHTRHQKSSGGTTGSRITACALHLILSTWSSHACPGPAGGVVYAA